MCYNMSQHCPIQRRKKNVTNLIETSDSRRDAVENLADDLAHSTQEQVGRGPRGRRENLRTAHDAHLEHAEQGERQVKARRAHLELTRLDKDPVRARKGVLDLLHHPDELGKGPV